MPCVKDGWIDGIEHDRTQNLNRKQSNLNRTNRILLEFGRLIEIRLRSIDIVWQFIVSIPNKRKSLSPQALKSTKISCHIYSEDM